MRPIAEIPSVFFEFEEALDEPMPLLERWLEARGGVTPLADFTVLKVQHQLANQFGQTEALIRLGVDPARVHWLDIPYTSHVALREGWAGHCFHSAEGTQRVRRRHESVGSSIWAVAGRARSHTNSSGGN